MGSSLKSARFLLDSRLEDAARGDPDACYDLGMVYSSGAAGIGVDLIEAHKWFNLAAVGGSSAAQACRAEIAEGHDRARDRDRAEGGARLARHDEPARGLNVSEHPVSPSPAQAGAHARRLPLSGKRQLRCTGPRPMPGTS